MKMNEKEFFYQATLRICSSLNLDTALERCLHYLKNWMPVTAAFMGYYDPGFHVGRIVASVRMTGIKDLPESFSLPLESWDLFKEKWFNGPTITIFNDRDKEDPQIRRILSTFAPGLFSHLILNLSPESRRIGAVMLLAEGKHRYTEEHARLLRMLHDPFAVSMNNILQHQEILRLKDLLADDNRYLHRRLLEVTGDTIIGADFGLKGVMGMVRRVATLDSPVLLMGETGAGKEVIANAIHYSSSRKDGPFIKVNCGAIPESLVDTELFGHEKGAFTGALGLKRGLFERAHTGTIFLDEIGELPPPVQVRLLRVIQSKELERVGGTKTIPVDVRIISATHRNLDEMVQQGRFREDLWYRLNVFPILIPPLRQRKEDIPALTAHFVQRKTRELKMHEKPSLAPGAMDRLRSYRWPGNVRELENLVERALIECQTQPGSPLLHFNTFPNHPFEPAKEADPQNDDPIRPLDLAMAEHITKALNRASGKVEGPDGAAAMLGLHPSTLRGRMRKLGIPHGRKP